MSTPPSTTAESRPTHRYAQSLRNLYVTRFAFALVWAGIVVATSASATEPSALLTALLVIYPAFDAGAVLWQLRADPDTERAKTAEWANVAVSVAVAIAIAFASSASIGAALAVWGIWAIVSGIPQLLAAVRHRRSGGQVPQILSGGISVFVGVAFLFQGINGSDAISGVAGYATVGAIFFVISAIRLTIVLRKGVTA